MDGLQHFYNKLQRHPFSFVKHILNLSIKNQYLSPDVMLKFSKYKYTPQSFSDERTNLSFPLSQFNEIIMYDIIRGLEVREELAFHSLIEGFGISYHLPLIDFGNVDRSGIDTSPLRELSEYWDMSFYIFNSGRSFHAYGNRLISSSNWIKFMGGLLLLNKPSGFKLIDERWIGHRLMAGYGALRWSANTPHYKKEPVFSGYLSSTGLEWIKPEEIWPLLQED